MNQILAGKQMNQIDMDLNEDRNYLPTPGAVGLGQESSRGKRKLTSKVWNYLLPSGITIFIAETSRLTLKKFIQLKKKAWQDYIKQACQTCMGMAQQYMGLNCSIQFYRLLGSLRFQHDMCKKCSASGRLSGLNILLSGP